MFCLWRKVQNPKYLIYCNFRTRKVEISQFNNRPRAFSFTARCLFCYIAYWFGMHWPFGVRRTATQQNHQNNQTTSPWRVSPLELISRAIRSNSLLWEASTPPDGRRETVQSSSIVWDERAPLGRLSKRPLIRHAPKSFLRGPVFNPLHPIVYLPAC